MTLGLIACMCARRLETFSGDKMSVTQRLSDPIDHNKIALCQDLRLKKEGKLFCLVFYLLIVICACEISTCNG